jgi:hypothetical protein
MQGRSDAASPYGISPRRSIPSLGWSCKIAWDIIENGHMHYTSHTALLLYNFFYYFAFFFAYYYSLMITTQRRRIVEQCSLLSHYKLNLSKCWANWVDDDAVFPCQTKLKGLSCFAIRLRANLRFYGKCQFGSFIITSSFCDKFIVESTVLERSA